MEKQKWKIGGLPPHFFRTPRGGMSFLSAKTARENLRSTNSDESNQIISV